ncbi:hypothetical protein TFLX_03045 [Thermoflexales bacterium]|nr:hypothetical protein TFLX_03045 [Thermoflexales bacterium]
MNDTAIKNASAALSRLLPVDALRGLIIVCMALDHANHFVAQKHPAGEMWGGAFPAYTDPLAFLTRLITHLSAPGFFFLMGVGMFLFAAARRKQGWSEWAIMRFFLIRGGILIALKFLLINRAWELSPGGWGLDIYIGVLFALGGTLILGSFFLRLKTAYLLIVTVVLFVGTELLVPARWGDMPLTNPIDLLNPLLITPGSMSEIGLWSNYPVLPWLELVIFGIAFGQWLAADASQTYRRALWLGSVFLLAFVVLRVFNGFGNIRPRMGHTWIDFFNVVKYPPSMTFTLLTMGVNLILLSAFARAGEKLRSVLNALTVFGRAPLFFYTLHLFLYAGLGWLFTPRGTSLPAMYPFWLLGLLILYPLCLWFGRLKQRQPAESLLRFF